MIDPERQEWQDKEHRILAAQQPTTAPADASVGLMQSAIALLAAVEERHAQPLPMKYTIPYDAVNALRCAVEAARKVLANKEGS